MLKVPRFLTFLFYTFRKVVLANYKCVCDLCK